ncbi:MAG: hypothetical protein IJT98_10335 [Prevotella sp.]|nr:hypothetical protein [Prevotella sp.]
MKKTYMKPSTLEAAIATQGMIAASDPKPFFDPDSEFNTMQSRRNSLWDDDDDDWLLDEDEF